MMKTSIVASTLLAGLVVLASCRGGGDPDEPAFETVDPYATDPAATTAPPAEMEPDTIGTDTIGQGPVTDTIMP